MLLLPADVSQGGWSPILWETVAHETTQEVLLSYPCETAESLKNCKSNFQE